MHDHHAKALSRQVGLIPSIRAASCANPFADGTHLLFGQSGRLDELFPDLEFRAPNGEGVFVVGSGCDLQPDKAFRKAIFETLERYAAAVYSTRDVIIASAEELGPEAFDWTLLEDLYVRAPGTNKWVGKPFDPRAPIRWVKGFHAVKRRDVHVPLVMAHVYAATRVGEDFHPQTTTGTAANTSLNDAIVSALCEVVERDAVETIWMTCAPLRQLDLDGPLPTGFAECERRRKSA